MTKGNAVPTVIKNGRQAAEIEERQHNGTATQQEINDLAEWDRRVDDDIDRTGVSTKFSSYTLPGGRNYKELLLTAQI